MLVTTPILGRKPKNIWSYSSASTTKCLPVPERPLLSILASVPPIITVGSSSASSKIWATIPVVVVLPCVPVMAMPVLLVIKLPSKSPRLSRGTPKRRASCISGLSSEMADERTTICAPVTLLARCPLKMLAPAWYKSAVRLVNASSDPETRKPRSSRTWAIADSPVPPMPIKWICLPFCFLVTAGFSDKC